MSETLDLAFQHEGDGPPVIMLHGLYGSGNNWRGVTGELTRHYHIIRPDLRNHGSAPHHPAMDYPSMAKDVVRLIDRLALGCLVGITFFIGVFCFDDKCGDIGWLGFVSNGQPHIVASRIERTGKFGFGIDLDVRIAFGGQRIGIRVRGRVVENERCVAVFVRCDRRIEFVTDSIGTADRELDSLGAAGIDGDRRTFVLG